MRIRTALAGIFVTGIAMAQPGPQRTLLREVSAQEPFIKTAEQNTFAASPVLPDCYTYAIERGDPTTGPSVTLSKLASGCKVPLHSHSANAQVLFVSGSFQLTMQGQQARILTPGSYAYVPAGHQHEESCLESCTYYVVREGVADVHYVDGHDKEISPEVALAAIGERPGAAASTRQ